MDKHDSIFLQSNVNSRLTLVITIAILFFVGKIVKLVMKSRFYTISFDFT
jgi:hypothetical protein